jgi:hypothetical protein
MHKILIILAIVILVAWTGQAQKNVGHASAKDTTLVGVVLDCDSTFQVINNNRFGTHYYYGIHHFKIGVIDIQDSIIKDTVVIAYVYNMHSELDNYLDNFDLKVNQSYIFDLSEFSPCKSDFPRLEGRCKLTEFFPLSNKLIKHYSNIYRVINATSWIGVAKRH